MMDRRTQDEKTPKGGDHGEEDPGGMGQRSGLGTTAWGRGGGDLGMLLGRGCLEEREL